MRRIAESQTASSAILLFSPFCDRFDLPGSDSLLLRALLPRDLRALLPRLGQADRDRLLAALHLAAFSALTRAECALLPALHRALDPLARGLPVFPSAAALLLCRHD